MYRVQENFFQMHLHAIKQRDGNGNVEKQKIFLICTMAQCW